MYYSETLLKVFQYRCIRESILYLHQDSVITFVGEIYLAIGFEHSNPIFCCKPLSSATFPGCNVNIMMRQCYAVCACLNGLLPGYLQSLRAVPSAHCFETPSKKKNLPLFYFLFFAMRTRDKQLMFKHWVRISFLYNFEKKGSNLIPVALGA